MGCGIEQEIEGQFVEGHGDGYDGATEVCVFCNKGVGFNFGAQSEDEFFIMDNATKSLFLIFSSICFETVLLTVLN